MRVDPADVRVEQHVRRLLGVIARHAEGDEQVLDRDAHHSRIDAHLELGRDVETLKHQALAVWKTGRMSSMNAS